MTALNLEGWAAVGRTAASLCPDISHRIDTGVPPVHPKIVEQDVRVAVTEASFEPQRVMLRAGAPARITFTRTSDKTCATAVVFASLNIRREVPLNVPVTVEFTPDKAGEIAFACGMNMLRGTVVVE